MHAKRILSKTIPPRALGCAVFLLIDRRCFAALAIYKGTKAVGGYDGSTADTDCAQPAIGNVRIYGCFAQT